MFLYVLRLSVCLFTFVSTTEEVSVSFSSKCYTLIHHKFTVSVCRCKHILQLHICTWQTTFLLRRREEYFCSNKISLAVAYLRPFKHRFAHASKHYVGTTLFFAEAKTGDSFAATKSTLRRLKLLLVLSAAILVTNLQKEKRTCSVKLSLISPKLR